MNGFGVHDVKLKNNQKVKKKRKFFLFLVYTSLAVMGWNVKCSFSVVLIPVNCRQSPVPSGVC